MYGPIKPRHKRPVFLGIFHRNDRQNIILDMDTCDSLGVGYNQRLVLYKTPDGQIVGKVIDVKYKDMTFGNWTPDGHFTESVTKVPDFSGLREYEKDDFHAYMPHDFLAPEDTRW